MFAKVAAIIMLAANMSMMPEGTMVYSGSTATADYVITKVSSDKYEMVADSNTEEMLTEGVFECGERAVTNGYWAVRTIGQVTFGN